MSNFRSISKKRIVEIILIVLLIASPIVLLLNQGFHFAETKEVVAVVISAESENTDEDRDELLDKVIAIGSVSQINRDDGTVRFQNIFVWEIEERLNELNSEFSEKGFSYEISQSIAKDMNRIITDVTVSIFITVIGTVLFIFFVDYRKQDPQFLPNWLRDIWQIVLLNLITVVSVYGLLSIFSRVYEVAEINLYFPIISSVIISTVFYLTKNSEINTSIQAISVLRQVVIIFPIILIAITLGLGEKFIVQAVLLFATVTIPIGYLVILGDDRLVELLGKIRKDAGSRLQSSSNTVGAITNRPKEGRATEKEETKSSVAELSSSEKTKSPKKDKKGKSKKRKKKKRRR